MRFKRGEILTKPLYLELPYQTTWTSNIKKYQLIDKRYTVIPEETIFYPQTLSGQSGDTGYINGVKVLRVYESEGDYYHVLAKPLEYDTQKVKMEVNRSHRDLILRNQTAQLLLSYILWETSKIKIRGLTIQSEKTTVDMSNAFFTDKSLKFLEDNMNTLIRENIEITVEYLDKEVCEELNLIYGIPLNKPNRVVHIQDYASVISPHIYCEHSGEIGHFKILNYQRVTMDSTRLVFTLD